jgi:DNA-directed RNA polymerase subunit beta
MQAGSLFPVLVIPAGEPMSNTRLSYGKLDTPMELPNLLQVQRDSFRNFLQDDLPASKRIRQGLQYAFERVFPIEDPSGVFRLEFKKYKLDLPKYEVEECKDRDMTFGAPLKVTFQLHVYSVDRKRKEDRQLIDIREETLYLGELPMMTDSGTFIINGAERVVVSQLHRSPGVFFKEDVQPGGRKLYSSRIIPVRGSWLDFSIDANDIMYLSIDRKRKMLITTFLRALGYASNAEILAVFAAGDPVPIAEKGKIIGAALATKVFDPHSDNPDETLYEYGTIIDKKVYEDLKANGIRHVRLLPDLIPIADAERLVGAIALEDVVDLSSGELLVEADREITPEAYTRIADAGIEAVRVIPEPERVEFNVIRRTLEKDNMPSKVESALRVYTLLRPGEPPNTEAAVKFFNTLFFNVRRYDLGNVGRKKLDDKLGLDIPLEEHRLDRDDIIETCRYLLKLRAGHPGSSTDDIDHLGNRIVLSVGELLEDVCHVGISRLERVARDRMAVQEPGRCMPSDLINSKPLTGAIKEFFGSSALSQFMDQVNPLSELTHKRRVSALGPGGLSRDRATFEVRDVHYTHYGRLCPIETPEGPNIGLINSLSTYARINRFGLIETPYRVVDKGKVTDKIIWLSAIDEEDKIVAQANTPLDKKGRLKGEEVQARQLSEYPIVTPDEVDYMDVSPKQVISVSTALIPFLEHDDANRALMGSNMQRQAVPLMTTEPPLVGTGVEEKAARDSGVLLLARRPGKVVYVSAVCIEVETGDIDEYTGQPQRDVYHIGRYVRSNQDTCINRKPTVRRGDMVEAGDVLADGQATSRGELALGRNVLVAFLPWFGYNYEDAIVISEELVRNDFFTSIHIEEYEIECRDTNLGREEITADIPNVSADSLRHLDETGIIRIGAEVHPGDILVGKVAPKGETELTPEEGLLRAIFGEKAKDVRDASLKAPPGLEGKIIGVKVFSRKSKEHTEALTESEIEQIESYKRAKEQELTRLDKDEGYALKRILVERWEDLKVTEAKPLAEEIRERWHRFTATGDMAEIEIEGDVTLDEDFVERVELALDHYQELKARVDLQTKIKIDRIERGDELPPGIYSIVKVYVARKSRLSVGDKMAGRHGNKGVIAKIVPVEDMPYMPDGTPIQMVLNPLGVPSRMNVGQILETHLGWAALKMGVSVATPVFEGATEDEIKDMLEKAELPRSGKITLRDGKTGEAFDSEVTVGYHYMLKLSHLAEEKIHARSIGPYSLVTQQPLGGRAQMGGQRFGEMEVWAVEAYGASHILRELLTVKSDDVPGRSKTYEAIVKGENTPEPGIPESFNVLRRELMGLCLDMELEE